MTASAVQPFPSQSFGITKEELAGINQDQMTAENTQALQKHEGVAGIAKKLNSSLTHGLSIEEKKSQFHERAASYGRNTYPRPPAKSFLSLVRESLKDPVLIFLIVASAFSFGMGLHEDPEKGWIEGFAIFMSVIIVVLVTSTNNYQKEKQFRALSAEKDKIMVKVLRGGVQEEVDIGEIFVGDLVVLATGDKIPADAVFIDGHEVKSNESSLTGEPDDVTKTEKKDPFLLSGCTITSGSAKCLVIAVGGESRWGRIKSKLTNEQEETPLMVKLGSMAKFIGYFGVAASILTAAAKIVLYFAHPDNHKQTVGPFFVEVAIIAVTIVVVSIPEGLPLAVTISLAYSTKKMLQDNNLIRVLSACETMGNATNICSDKTGTLTENRMTVVAAWFDNQLYPQGSLPDTSPSYLRPLLSTGIAYNSSAVLRDKGDKIEVIGNKTEGALLMYLKKIGEDYEKVRAGLSAFPKGSCRVYPFSSEKKRMSTLVKDASGGGHKLYCKGASEMILANCSHVLGRDGKVIPIDAKMREELHTVIISMAQEALRTIGVAHKDFPFGAIPDNLDSLEQAPDSDMVLDAIFGIIDPLRPDVKDAVRECQTAGIMVRMVTGDNIHTASAIAKQCGILTAKGMALEGPVFRNMTDDAIDQILPKLQVLARSSPDDKFKLVTRLKKNGEVVGVTGDGTNDAPALKASDVGLAMGLSGTEVAKEASSIVIMDDRFFSIRQSVLWGRCVYDNIRKFLQFQLTVNVVALSVTFIAAVADFDPPLNAVMMLWVNLIMDTLGALALGTEAPSDSMLLRRPYKRNARLISKLMARNILVQSIFQLCLQMVLLFAGPKLIPDIVNSGNFCLNFVAKSSTDEACKDATSDKKPSCFNCTSYDYTHFSVIFNAFVFCQLFNEINARSIGNDWNVFKGLLKNHMFMGILLLTAVAQIILVQVGGDFIKTAPLTVTQWLLAIGLASLSLPLGILMRLIPVSEDEDTFAGYDIKKLQ